MPKPKTKAAKKSAVQTPQRNRTVTKTAASPESEIKSSNQVREAAGFQPVEETDEDRAAAGEARRQKVSTPGQLGKDPEQVYKPERQTLENEGFDDYGAEQKRQAELAAEREEHNRRTGDASRP